jgi:hypothetical protein
MVLSLLQLSDLLKLLKEPKELELLSPPRIAGRLMHDRVVGHGRAVRSLLHAQQYERVSSRPVYSPRCV